ADQLPQGTLELRRRGAALLRRQAQSRENHVPYGLLGAVVIGAHQAVADRVDPGAGIPVLDQPPEFGTARVIEHGLGIEHAQQEGAPAAEVQRAVIELDAEHVRGRHVAVQRDAVVADLRGARAEVVLRAEGGPSSPMSPGLVAAACSASHEPNQQACSASSTRSSTPSAAVFTSRATGATPRTRISSRTIDRGTVPVSLVSARGPTAVQGRRLTPSQVPLLLVKPQAMCPFDPATSSGAPGSVTPLRSTGVEPRPGTSMSRA